jgi:hypothetical protein
MKILTLFFQLTLLSFLPAIGKAGGEEFYPVPFSSLLLGDQSCSKNVLVSGVFYYKGQRSALFMSTEDYQYHLIQESIRLDFEDGDSRPDIDMNGKHVSVVGKVKCALDGENSGGVSVSHLVRNLPIGPVKILKLDQEQ